MVNSLVISTCTTLSIKGFQNYFKDLNIISLSLRTGNCCIEFSSVTEQFLSRYSALELSDSSVF